MEFNDLINSDKLHELHELEQLKVQRLVQRLSISHQLFEYLVTAFSRIWAAKPHSWDVERVISYEEFCKELCAAVDTQNLYLYIRLNMCALEDWDNRPCIIKWLSERDRRTGSTEKAKCQRWFKGTAKEANCSNDRGTKDMYKRPKFKEKKTVRKMVQMTFLTNECTVT